MNEAIIYGLYEGGSPKTTNSSILGFSPQFISLKKKVYQCYEKHLFKEIYQNKILMLLIIF
ncbi:MAG: hypothetical protein NC934_05100 [Candidatus Omnitrophica bacterium]|nr:hypothetical protein [Candidatus Omnitrophota bacterium]